MSHTTSRSRSETQEWVPWKVIEQRFGEVEAARRLMRKTIDHRPDPVDKNERQFCINRVVERRRLKFKA
jgi:hypothetical protein